MTASQTQRRACDRSARPLFSFGVISDVQYADIPDGHSAKGVPRFYRNSLTALAAAVDSWRDAGVHFCMHLGDIIDGFNPKDQSEASLVSSERRKAA